MKKIEFKEKSITPLWTKDLCYIQSGFRDTIGALCESFLPKGKNFMIVSGCSMKHSNNIMSIGDGWVFYSGELYRVHPDDLPCDDPNATIYLNKVYNYDNSGKRIVILNESSQFIDLYRDDYLIPSLEYNKYSIGAIKPGAWDLSERIVKQSKLTDSGWVNADWATDNAADKDSSTCIQYRWIGNIVQLSGKIDVQGNITVPNLPVPSKDFSCIRLINKDSIFRKRIDIKANNNYGELTVNPQASGEVSLDDIVYTTDTYYTGNLNDGHMTL